MQITKNTPVNVLLAMSKDCKACSKSCSYGSGYMTKDDIKKLASHMKISEDVVVNEHLEQVEHFNTKGHKIKLNKKQGEKHKPYGPCKFLSANNDCSIHDAKPLYCKLTNNSEHAEQIHSWFLLHNFLNKNDAESVRQYASHLKTGGVRVIGASLEELFQDKKKLGDALNYTKL